jgi:hypothetical protein
MQFDAPVDDATGFRRAPGSGMLAVKAVARRCAFEGILRNPA